jgi:tetratricopeptide (TPR) repeat protein
VDLTEYLKRVPSNAWAVHHRSAAYLALGDVDHALADARRAIELDPVAYHFRVLKARILERTKNYQQAAAAYAEAIRVCSESERGDAYKARGDFENSQSEFDPALADYDEAIRLNKQKIEAGDVSPLVSRARIYLAQGKNDLAIGDIDEALRISPGYGWARFIRGHAFARKRDWVRSLEDFKEEMSRQHTTKANLLNAIGCVLVQAGRLDEAETSFQESIKGNEGYRTGMLSCRAFYLHRVRGDYQAALKDLDSAAQYEWPLGTFLYRGVFHARMGKPDLALADFEKLLKIEQDRRRDFFGVEELIPRRLLFLLGRGEANFKKGNLEQAQADCDAAVRFAPKSAEARILRAQVHARRGLKALAEADLREAGKLGPDPFLDFPRL